MIAIGRLFVYNFETFDSWCQHESRIQTHRYQRLSSDAAMAFALVEKKNEKKTLGSA